MDDRGFLPRGTKCFTCGATLQGEGDGRPAESYAGTFTGLCYACERGRTFPTNEVEVSGAKWYSHPPHCPSWRRDRESFYGFDGCKKCGGRGRIMTSSHLNNRFPIQCPDCEGRHDGHPEIVVKRRREEIRSLAIGIWAERGNEEYARRLKKISARLGFGRSWAVAKTMDPSKIVAGQVIAEMPSRPEGPELGEFPKEWAEPGKAVVEKLQKYTVTHDAS